MQTAVDPNATVGVRAGCAGAPEPEPQIEPEPEPEIDMMAAAPNIILSAVLPIIFGWMLFLTQLVVVFMVKDSIATVLKIKGCNSAAELGSFLAKIDAEIEVRSHLPAVNMFEGASAAFLDAVTSLLKLQNFQKGQELFKQGDPGESMFFICKGSAGVVSVPDDNKVLGTLGPGDYVGEMSILLQQPRSKSVIAAADCVVFELNADDLVTLEDDFPERIYQVIRYVSILHPHP